MSIVKINESITYRPYYRLFGLTPCPFPCLFGYLPSDINTNSMSLESTFIRNVLKEEGQRLKRNAGKAISREVKFHTKRLLDDRTIEVLDTPASGGTLVYTVPAYNRLLDIKQERKKKSGIGTSLRSLRIYNRFVYGAYYSIAFRVANDFTDEVKAQIRQIGGANG
ncbi:MULTISPECIES: hypothetical protein [Sphingobacterium]|nr:MULTISPECIES: hypothetical protein [Sphingobacterium]